MDLQCILLVAMHLFYLDHGYAHLGETIVIFADGASRFLVPELTCSKHQ
jgi:hypothetical protein